MKPVYLQKPDIKLWIKIQQILKILQMNLINTMFGRNFSQIAKCLIFSCKPTLQEIESTSKY